MTSRLGLALFAITCALFSVIAVIAIRQIGKRADTAQITHQPASPFRGGSMPNGIYAPKFTLTDQNGKKVSMAAYRGKPVVVTYLYTRCKDSCAVQAAMIRGALDDLGRDVPALAISVDPSRDTPAGARAFNRRAKMTGRMRWVLGTRRQLQPVWRGFAIKPLLSDPAHQAYITLVDAKGRQRVAVPIGSTSPEDLAYDIGVLQKLGT